MLTVHHLSKAFDLEPLFENVTFSINTGERVGLVGPNGCGKTTLLRLMTGTETADTGHVACDPGARVGYLAQGFELDPHTTLGDLVGRTAGSVASLEEELAGLAQALVREPGDAGLQLRYDKLLQRISRADVGRAAAILDGLGLAALDPDFPVARLSGGQKTRLMLALVLLDDPDLLLLDEPTNHLDIEMLEWLEAWLAQFEGGALIVSHDRTFLDRTVTRILEMDPKRRAVREYAGNYTDYLAQKTAEREKQWSAYKDQQQEIRRIKEDIARVRAQAAYTERQASSVRIGGGMMALKGYKDYQRTIAKKVAKKAKARARKLERYLDDAERVEKPERAWRLKLDFNNADHLGKWALEANGLHVGYAGYAPLLCDLHLEVQAGERIVLTGPNGAGKTSLLRTIAGELPPLAGELRLGGSVRLGYMTQEQTNLDPARSALETIQPVFGNPTDARTFLSYFLFVDDEPLKPNALLSYGQRARLMLALLIAEGCNFLLLDEPINHLDVPSRAQFEQALAHFEGTVLAVVHDRYFIDRFATQIWWIEDQGIRRG